jgi:hypothetical protein
MIPRPHSHAAGFAAVLAALCPLVIATAVAAAPAPARRAPAAAPRAAAPAARTQPARPSLERDTLAWAGDRAVTALDLVQRIEWMPWPEKHGQADLDSAKTRALESLVAEALLAQESRREAPGDSVTPLRAALRRALLRDALYQQVVAGAPAPAAAEVGRLVRLQHPRAAASEQPALRRAVADSLRALGDMVAAGEFLMDHLVGRRVEVDSSTFVLLADSLRELMVRAHDDPVPGGAILVPAYAADALTAGLARSLDRTLARLPDGPLSLRDAIDDLHFYQFGVHSLEPGRFAIEFNQCLRRIVEGEVMAREGARRNLDRLPAVQHDLERWTDAWRAGHLLARLATASRADDDEAFRTLALNEPERARGLCEVDLSEILCGSRAEAAELAGEIALGARFDSIATRRSRRSEWAANGGRSGFFPVGEHPDLGYVALLALPDTLTGPVQLPEGYALLRVHGKRLRADSAQAPALLERARAAATGERRVQALASHVAGLANATSVRMNYAALRKVEILASNMVVKRSLGFGGGMTASPSLAPMWQWTRRWRGHAAPSP